MSNATTVQSGITTILSRIREQINQDDTEGLLAIISDPRWISHTDLQLTLLREPDTMARLLDHGDEFVQFTVYRLVKEILVNADFLEMNPSMHLERQRLVQDLFQKLISTRQPIPGQKRTILELFHALMKFHRQRLRSLGTQNGITTPTIAMARSYWYGMDHVATAVVRELATPAFWASTFKHILSAADTQHAVLVLLIDIEKARISILHSETFNMYVIACHWGIIKCMEQLMRSPDFEPSTLKKIYELMCLALQPCHHSGTEYLIDQDHDLDMALEFPIRIVMALSPLAFQILTTLNNIDPYLENISTVGTTFILSKNLAYRSVSKDIQPFVNNPETIRQLGRVFFSAILSILGTLTALTRVCNTPSTHLSSNDRCHHHNRDRSGDKTSESLSSMQELVNSLFTFSQDWIGTRALNVILLIYGEDDAGVSWLLKTMSLIQQQFQDLLVRHRPFLFTFIDINVLDELYDHLHAYVHPMDAFLLFLETIGYDHQTLLDLLLTMDDHETGGFLAAVMGILRHFTENETDRQRLLGRWCQEMNIELGRPTSKSQDDIMDGVMDSTMDDAHDDHSATVTRLFSVASCLDRLTDQIRALDKNNLFPYNPRALLVALTRTQDTFSTLLLAS